MIDKENQPGVTGAEAGIPQEPMAEFSVSDDDHPFATGLCINLKSLSVQNYFIYVKYYWKNPTEA